MKDCLIYGLETARMLLNKKMNGVFYTPKLSARFLANRVLSYTNLKSSQIENLRIIDPMVGSGELLLTFCEEMLKKVPREEKKELIKLLPQMICGTDKDQIAVKRTKHNLASALSDLTGNNVEPNSFFNILCMDALQVGDIEQAFPNIFQRNNPGFSIIVANPPWEIVKVNDREFFSIYDQDFRRLTRDSREKKKKIYLSKKSVQDNYRTYKKAIIETKGYIANHYQLTKGLGEINLYRTSLERILHLAKMGGIIGIITPTGLAGEYSSRRIREELLLRNKILEMWGFSIGAKLFPEADVSPLFTILSRGGITEEFLYQTAIKSIKSAFLLLNENLPRIKRKLIMKLSPDDLAFIPISSEIEFGILNKIYRFCTWKAVSISNS